MDGLSAYSTVGKQKPRHKITNQISRDIYYIAREGSLSELDFALVQLKHNGGNIDAKNIHGLTALHIATWRNHVPIVKRLLAAGADPNTRDSESGWTSLHRSVHFGHLAVAGILLKFGASLTVEDSKGRTPADLLCGPVYQVVGAKDGSAITEVFSWGNGANYQLGTGNADIQKLPCKVETLQGTYIKIVAAAKFHSVAVGANGELYSWGFGRGGRLGHPDFDIHSGQAAVITPRQVISGLGHRRVKAVSAAKHHTVVATEAGEVFTWGSNREGQLGYTSVDTQATPRRVSSLKSKVVAVAAANKHTVVVSESGEVFTWGCNKEGQLGYGTSNSASNCTPRVVEYLKCKQFVAVSTAKYHTLVLGADGEVYTWGNRLVNPRRVAVSRSTGKNGSLPLKFHRQERLHVVAVAAGMVHSSALTSDGALFYWVSSDPDLRCQQLYSMCDRHFVNISAGKYWTAAVTDTGDVYMWDGKKSKDVTPVACRLHGVKHATLVSSGETHLLIISTLYQPPYSSKADKVTKQKNVDKTLDDLNEDFIVNDLQRVIPPVENDNSETLAPSLKSLCQKAACKFIVEPRNAIQLLEISDALEADELWSYCEDIALRNFDFILSLASSTVSNASFEILAKLERSLDERSSESWSCRRLPTTTATFPAVVNSEEETGCGSPQLRVHQPSSGNGVQREGIGFLQQESAADQAISKQIRAARKKLQQIDMLEAKLAKGQSLDDQQIVKVQSRPCLEGALAELGVPVEVPKSPSVVAESKSSRKGGHKKQRQKYKQKNDIVKPHEEHVADIEPTSFEGYTSDVDSVESKVKVDVEPQGISNLGSHEQRPSFGQREKQKPVISKSGSTKNTRKKGGLSLFLSGGLDDTPPLVASPPSPRRFGPATPAWGGVRCSTGPTSLLDIQEEQKKMERTSGVKGKDGYECSMTERGGSISIKLGSFFPGSPSSPIAVLSAHSPAASEGDKSTPPWAMTGTSPVLCRPSLRDIQMQEEKRQLHFQSHSPKTRSQGFTVGSTSETGLSVTPKETPPNRWYKQETDAPSSLRAIQIEEAAIKDLRRYYSNVKLVKKPILMTVYNGVKFRLPFPCTFACRVSCEVDLFPKLM